MNSHVNREVHPIVGLNSRNIQLRCYQQEDSASIYQWHTELEHLHLWTQDRDIPDKERFKNRFERRMKNRIDLFFMIEPHNRNPPVGFIYNYSSDSVDGVTYLCIFIDQRYKSYGYGVEGTLLFLNHLFNYYGFRKVYFEVYGFNEHVIKLAQKTGLPREGCLAQHRYWNGTFWDQYIYSIDRTLFEDLLNKYLPYLKPTMKRHGKKRR